MYARDRSDSACGANSYSVDGRVLPRCSPAFRTRPPSDSADKWLRTALWVSPSLSAISLGVSGDRLKSSTIRLRVRPRSPEKTGLGIVGPGGQRLRYCRNFFTI